MSFVFSQLWLAQASEAGAMGTAADLTVRWLLGNGDALFSLVNATILTLTDCCEQLLNALVPWLLALVVALLGLWRVSAAFGLLSLFGLNLVQAMGLWEPMISTLALVLTASFLAITIGLPLGVLAARQRPIWQVTRPLLDLMQTMPAFVYLIPAVMLFSTGAVPSVIATLIFAMPPVVRLTVLGIDRSRLISSKRGDPSAVRSGSCSPRCSCQTPCHTDDRR